jgi:hypothetical protein
MVFKATQTLAAPSALPDIQLPLTDTQALLQTALRASWQRDRSVGRRRRVMRWIMWWSWKFLLPLVLICGAITAIVDQLAQRGYLEPWLPTGPIIPLSSVARTPSPAAPSIESAPRSVENPPSAQSAAPVVAAESGLRLQLDMRLEMSPRAAHPATVDDSAVSSSDPIALKNTTQLKTKELPP